jgi:DNA mismatch endonuclease (patch repair protein)
MAAIRSRTNRTTEVRFRAFLMRTGFQGWTVQPRVGMGNPDFLFPGRRVVVFVDGCFWHGCPRCGHVPSTNSAYWTAKIARNQMRDRSMSRVWRSAGYTVVRVWECELRRSPERCLDRLRRHLRVPASRRP